VAVDAGIALVTGGGRGIGRAIALRFAREGWRVAVAARSTGELERVRDEIDRQGGEGLAVPMDVTDLASVEAGVDRALALGDGRLDVLVNNAGVFTIHPFPELSPATWYRTIATNLTGPFHVTLLALRGLERSSRAHVFNVSSIAGKRAFPGNAAYCASKYGLRGLSDALRLDLAERHIRVSTVFPAQTDTPIWDRVPGDWDRARMNRPEDVAEVVWRAYRAPLDADVGEIEVPPPAQAGIEQRSERADPR
jgi:NAD(P)-dependent dehydrogenase (short-subunit alcohol dehydrogenase family)